MLPVLNLQNFVHSGQLSISTFQTPHAWSSHGIGKKGLTCGWTDNELYGKRFSATFLTIFSHRPYFSPYFSCVCCLASRGWCCSDIDCSSQEGTHVIAEGNFPVASGKKKKSSVPLLSRDLSLLKFQMSYGNGALFCFTRVCLVVQGVCCCQWSSARTYGMGQSNISLRACLLQQKRSASSSNARYSSWEVRGKSRMDWKYWQYAQLIWEFLMQ